MKKILAIAAVVMAITACQKEDPRPPQAAIQNASGKTTIEFGESLTLKASVISELPVTIAWSVDGVAVAGATSETFEFKGEKAGAQVITLTATNADGTDTDQLTITVNAPLAPTAVIEPPQGWDAPLEQGRSIHLLAVITSVLETTQTWSVDGKIVEGATGTSFDFSSDEPGEHTITLTVKSAAGETTASQVIVVASLVDFEDAATVAGPTLACENFYSDFDGTRYTGYTHTATGLTAAINPTTSQWGNYWNGVAVSNFHDMETGGLANQCSVYYTDAATGNGGQGGSANFAVGFDGTIEFSDDAAEGQFYYMWVTNNTYAALSMMNGDAYAKKFSYEDEDWLKLTITATDASGAATGEPVEFHLADFSKADSPGIITEWTKISLASLGDKVHKLTFTLSSSDNSTYDGGETYYMNTPNYFCFDTVAFLKK